MVASVLQSFRASKNFPELPDEMVPVYAGCWGQCLGTLSGLPAHLLLWLQGQKYRQAGSEAHRMGRDLPRAVREFRRIGAPQRHQ